MTKLYPGAQSPLNLENWAERVEAPEKLIAAHLKKLDATHPVAFPLDPAHLAFARPVYPYPVRVKYIGHSDPNDAANFVPVNP